MSDDDSADGTYQVHLVETEAGTFVEIFDSAHEDDGPVAFMSLDSAVQMANAIQKANVRHMVSGAGQGESDE